MSRTRRSWTAREDALLRDLVQKELDNQRPLLWRELAKHIPGRSNKDCRKRWWNSLVGGTAKGAWSPEEDRKLVEAVGKYGTNWSRVAAAVGTRSGDQCSSHWRQVLNPNINYCDWTKEEDDRLLEAVRICGTNWSNIASFHVPQRTTLALKNRYWKLRSQSQQRSEAQTGATSPRPAPSPGEKSRSTPALPSPAGEETDEDDGDDDDDDDEDDDDQNNGDGEAEARNANVYMDMDVVDWGLDGNWLATKPSSSSEEQQQRPPDAWPPYQEPMPKTKSSGSSSYATPATDQWMGDLIDPALKGGTTAGPEPPGGSFLTHPASGDQAANNLPFAMDLNLEASPGAPSPAGGMAALSPMDTMTATTTPPSSFLPQAGMWEPRETPQAAAAAAAATQGSLHRVSFTLSCTTSQLSNIMSVLASTGLGVQIKIETH